MKLKGIVLASAAPIAFAACPAYSAVTITFSEVGGNVELTAAGSFDYGGMTLVATGTAAGGSIVPGNAAVITNTGSFGIYAGLSGPSSLGPGASSEADSASGDLFGLIAFNSGAGAIIESSYVSGAPLSASSTYLSSTFASLGLTPGTYVYTAPNDTITVQIGPLDNAVPEPGTWAMMLLGFGAMGWSFKRRRKMALA